MGFFLRKKGISVTGEDGKTLWPYGAHAESEVKKAQVKESRMVTPKELDDRTEAIAKEHGWREENCEAEWKGLLASFTERRADGRVVYRLPETCLGELIKWKRSLKHSGDNMITGQPTAR
ncbi:MAG: hypothetical protein EXS31_11020 [Pedosphaera sp.]|nr:hypothetical protein [Pedosphaera sp.]